MCGRDSKVNPITFNVTRRHLLIQTKGESVRIRSFENREYVKSTIKVNQRIRQKLLLKEKNG